MTRIIELKKRYSFGNYIELIEIFRKFEEFDLEDDLAQAEEKRRLMRSLGYNKHGRDLITCPQENLKRVMRGIERYLDKYWEMFQAELKERQGDEFYFGLQGEFEFREAINSRGLRHLDGELDGGEAFRRRR